MHRFLALAGYLNVRHFLQVLMPQRCSPSPSLLRQYLRAQGYLRDLKLNESLFGRFKKLISPV